MTPMHRAPRLCLLIYGLTGGGVPRLTLVLAQQFIQRGWQVDLALIGREVRQEKPELAGLRYVQVNGWPGLLPWVRAKRKRQYWLARWGFARYLRREAPDAVIAADVSVALAALHARRAAAFTAPMVLSVHNSLDYLDRKKPAMAAGLRKHFPSADAVIAVSRGIAAQLEHAGVAPHKLSVLPNPVIGDDFDSKIIGPTPAFDFAHGGPTVIGVGRLAEQKDFATLLRAFQHLLAQRPDARLLILGEGPERGALQALVRELGIGAQVQLPGAVPSALPYIARAQLLVLSSIREGMPSVLIEAMACGTPVASTDCETGPADILDDGRFGPLVPTGDWRALGNAMARVLADPPAPEMLRERGRAYTAERSADAYCTLLDALGVRP